MANRYSYTGQRLPRKIEEKFERVLGLLLNHGYTETADLVRDIRDYSKGAVRWQAMQTDGLVDIRIDGQEFTGISNMDAWADGRLDATYREEKRP